MQQYASTYFVLTHYLDPWGGVKMSKHFERSSSNNSWSIVIKLHLKHSQVGRRLLKDLGLSWLELWLRPHLGLKLFAKVIRCDG